MLNLKINIYKNDVDNEEYYKIEKAKVKRIKTDNGNEEYELTDKEGNIWFGKATSPSWNNMFDENEELNGEDFLIHRDNFDCLIISMSPTACC